MSRSRHSLGFGRVNRPEKVKVDGEWKFCPAVVEPGRRLNDAVRVKGLTETHSEGAYYLEWREKGKRRRQPVRNRSLVFEQARLKALELESQHYGREIGPTQSSALTPSPLQFSVLASVSSSSISAAHLISRGGLDIATPNSLLRRQ